MYLPGGLHVSYVIIKTCYNSSSDTQQLLQQRATSLTKDE